MSLIKFLAFFGLWRRPPTVADLKFPVLAISEDGSEVVILTLEPGQDVTRDAIRNPRNGTVLIDSDFRMYTERNVACRQGDLGYLYRLLFDPGKPYTYRFDL